MLAAHLVGAPLPGAAWLGQVASLDVMAPACPLNAAIASLQGLHVSAHQLGDNLVVLDKYRTAALGSVTSVAPSLVSLRL